MKQGG